MNNRTRCKCGCGASVARRRLGTVWATEACRKRFERRSVAQNADITRTRSRSGLQVSYRKAVSVLAFFLRHAEPEWRDHEWTAEMVLRAALSERQRERVRS